MNKRLISYLTLVAFAITSVPGRADVVDDATQELVAGVVSPSLSSNGPVASSIEDENLGDDYLVPDGKEVHPSDDKVKNAARRQMWINIGLAFTAVVVAVIALCVVSNNNGHHHHSQ